MAEQDTPIVMKGEKMDTDEVSLAPTEICIRLMVELPLRQVGYDYGQDMKTTIDRTARENLVGVGLYSFPSQWLTQYRNRSCTKLAKWSVCRSMREQKSGLS